MSNPKLDSKEAIIKMREEPNFDKIKLDIVALLDTHREIVLATSTNDRVTARVVSFANNGLDIYFLSWEHNKKIQQLKDNPKVALCLKNLEIEGLAEVLGNAFEDKYNDIGDLFKSKFSPKWFDTFSHIKEMVLVKITLNNITKFENINRRFHLQNVDIVNKKVYQMRIEDKDHKKFPY
jgi:general stress protein 26